MKSFSEWNKNKKKHKVSSLSDMSNIRKKSRKCKNKCDIQNITELTTSTADQAITKITTKHPNGKSHKPAKSVHSETSK